MNDIVSLKRYMGRLINLEGKKFGRLTVLSRKKESTYVNGEILWECICSCAKKTILYAVGSQLRRGDKKSCGCLRKPDYLDFLHKLQVKLVENSKWNGQCLEWAGFKNKNGYGQVSITINGIERPIGVHRASWLVYEGEIPIGMFVCHHCDNPACHRIEHLFIGTHTDNMRDMIMKGRNRSNHEKRSGNFRTGSNCSYSKLKEEQVKEILESKNKGISSHVLCKQYGVAASTIRSIWQRKNWKHI